jgi:hypothetical protein
MERMQNTKKHVLLGAILLLLSCSIVSVSAYIYEQNSQNVTQTIVDIATLTLTNSTLGNLEEGQTLLYIPSNQSDLDDIISVTTTKANVYLHLDSDLDSLTDYATYNIVVKFSQVQGSTYSVGDTACTLTLGSPDFSSIDLDVAGTWIFDFEVTTTASTVSADVPSTVTITVSAESTS